MSHNSSPDPNQYTIGWICALPDELVGAEAMLDEHYDCPPQPRSDHNKYTVGRIATHNIAIACLPAGLYGTTSATRVAEQMQSTFQALRFTLMVGIGGGAPSDENDVRLGDVVVSQPTNGHGGVINYTFGKTLSGEGFQHTGFLGKPPHILLNAMAHLKSKHRLHEPDLLGHLNCMVQQHNKLRGTFEYQGEENDHLYLAEYAHAGGRDCDKCDPVKIKIRPVRPSHSPVIHYGLIASADIVMKDAIVRDKLQQQHGILCFEMEAAGLMNGLDCLVIRGICDYSDSHKNKRWQPYAAAASAAYAKELIYSLPIYSPPVGIMSPLQGNGFSHFDQIVGSMNDPLSTFASLVIVDRQKALFAANSGLEATKSSTMLNSSGSLGQSVYLNIYPRNSRFFGRNDVLQMISEHLLPSMQDTPRLRSFALYGLAGIGKSQIATEFVYRSMRSFKAVFWVSASSEEKLFQGFTEIARELNLNNGTTINDQQVIVHLVKEWLQKTSEAWLLNPASEYQLANNGIEVKTFSPEESTAWFCQQLGRSTVLDEEARKITESFGHHTLTIKQMASYIRESQCTISQFQEAYADSTKRQQLLATPNELSAPGYAHTTITAFAVTFLKLGINALHTLGILSFLDPDRIPEELLEDTEDRVPFLASIMDRHTIMRDLGLVHTVSEEIDSDEAKAQAAFRGAVALLHQRFPLQSEARSHMNEKWIECEKLTLSYDFIELLYCSAWYLYERGRLDLSSSIVGSAELAYHRADLQDHGLLLADLYSLQSDLYNELTQANKAVELAKKSLEIKKAAVKAKVLDRHHPQIANSYMDIGVFIGGANPQAAIRLHEKAIRIREQSPKYADQQMQLLSLNYMNLGRCWWMIKELDKATAAYQKSLHIIKRLEDLMGAPFAQTAWTMSALANVLIDQEKIDAAFDLYTQSMKVHLKVLGPTHHKTAACYNKLAWFLQKQGEYKMAIEYLQLSLKVHTQKQSVDTRPEIARTKYQLSQVLHEFGETEEGDELKAEAQQLRLQLTGKKPGEDESQESYDELIAYFYR
ncbi:hypothetical protein MKX08_001202 [Trichoderma sp. CBMAI-0020]|nr:hypothetical protein MKX08_001202 [Trichoderma sp. CBMAI-0020]